MASKTLDFSIPSHLQLALPRNRGRLYLTQASLTGSRTIYKDEGQNHLASVQAASQGLTNIPRKGYKVHAYNGDRVILVHTDFKKGVELDIDNFMLILSAGALENTEFIFISVKGTTRFAALSQVKADSKYCVFDGVGIFNVGQDTVASAVSSGSSENVVIPATTDSLVPYNVVPEGALFRYPQSKDKLLKVYSELPIAPANNVLLGIKGFHSENSKQPLNKVIIEEDSVLDDKGVARLKEVYNLKADAFNTKKGWSSNQKCWNLLDRSNLERFVSNMKKCCDAQEWVSTIASKETLLTVATAMSKVSNQLTYVLTFKGQISVDNLKQLLIDESTKPLWLKDVTISNFGEYVDTANSVEIAVSLTLQFKYKRDTWYATVETLSYYVLERDGKYSNPTTLHANKNIGSYKVDVLSEELSRLSYMSTVGVAKFQGYCPSL